MLDGLGAIATNDKLYGMSLETGELVYLPRKQLKTYLNNLLQTNNATESCTLLQLFAHDKICYMYIHETRTPAVKLSARYSFAHAPADLSGTRPRLS